MIDERDPFYRHGTGGGCLMSKGKRLRNRIQTVESLPFIGADDVRKFFQQGPISGKGDGGEQQRIVSGRLNIPLFQQVSNIRTAFLLFRDARKANLTSACRLAGQFPFGLENRRTSIHAPRSTSAAFFSVRMK